jgi:hypothetical protein
MMFTVGDLREALRGVPDEALLELNVVLQDTNAVVGRPSINAADLSEPDMLGFRICRIEAEMPFADMVTSKALEHVPPFALEEVVATGKAPTVEDIEDGMYEP